MKLMLCTPKSRSTRQIPKSCVNYVVFSFKEIEAAKSKNPFLIHNINLSSIFIAILSFRILDLCEAVVIVDRLVSC